MVTRSELVVVVEEVLDDHEVESAGGVAGDIADRLMAEFPDAFYEETDEDAEE
jgi:hypothetical protein